MSDYTGGEDGYTPQQASAHNFVDVNTLARHENPNYEGTPTQFFDDEGNLKAILADLHGQGSSQQFVDPYSFNPILKEGEKISADSARQAHNENNELLFLDAEGNQTTRNTGNPMAGGTLRDVMYEKDPGSRGGFLPKDTYQGLALLAAMGTLGALSPALMAGEGALGAGALESFTAGEMGFAGAGGAGSGGAGALGGAGAVAEAFPVSSGALLSGTELGGAGALGLTDAEATALMGQYAPGALGGSGSTGLTASEALRYANLAKSALGATGALGGASGASGATSRSGGSNALAQMTPYNQQYLSTGAAPTTNVSGLIDYKPLPFAEPTHYANFSDIKPLSMFDKSPFESGLHAAHGGHIQESMGRHPELQDIDPRLLSMIMQSMAFQDGDKRHVPEFITGATGHYVKGKGDGQSDDIPAMLADGEFVWDADTVAQLGNGSSDAGAKFLDKFREAVRAHKRSAPNDKIPPKASPLQYVKEAMKNTEKE